MGTFITNLWAIIFPLRATAAVVKNTTNLDMLQLYRPVVHANWTALLPYQNTTVKSCIAEAKFYNNRRAQKLLHAVIAHHLEQTNDLTSTLVPIPLSSAREKKRGHNQVRTILTCDTKIKNNVQNYLNRKIDTEPQSQLSKRERIQNMNRQGIFSMCKTISNSKIIICDDVVTTGATLGAAKKAFSSNTQTTVSCIAIAH